MITSFGRASFIDDMRDSRAYDLLIIGFRLAMIGTAVGLLAVVLHVSGVRTAILAYLLVPAFALVGVGVLGGFLSIVFHVAPTMAKEVSLRGELPIADQDRMRKLMILDVVRVNKWSRFASRR